MGVAQILKVKFNTVKRDLQGMKIGHASSKNDVVSAQEYLVVLVSITGTTRIVELRVTTKATVKDLRKRLNALVGLAFKCVGCGLSH